MEKIGEYVLLLLSVLPFVGIGFVCGMLFMRGNYLTLLRKAEIEKNRMMRYVEKRATNERHLGYAVGMRDAERFARK